MQKGINIMVSRQVHAKLSEIGKKGETFDQILNRILEK
jgi:hypothetical protein